MLLSLAVSALAGLTGMLISPGTAKAGTLLFEAIPFGQTEKPVFPDGGGEDPGEADEFFPNLPICSLRRSPLLQPHPSPTSLTAAGRIFSGVHADPRITRRTSRQTSQAAAAAST